MRQSTSSKAHRHLQRLVPGGTQALLSGDTAAAAGQWFQVINLTPNPRDTPSGRFSLHIRLSDGKYALWVLLDQSLNHLAIEDKITLGGFLQVDEIRAG